MNEISIQMLNKLYDSIKEDGVEIRECDLAELDAKINADGIKSQQLLDNQRRAGFYFCKGKHLDANVSDYPEYLLCIDRSICLDEKYLFTIHEWGHHKCHICGCLCCDPDYFHPIHEAHAHHYVIHYLNPKELPYTLFKYVNNLVKLTFSYFKEEYWDTQVAYVLFAYLLKRVDPLSGLPRKNLSKIEQFLGSKKYQLALNMYNTIRGTSIESLYNIVFGLPQVQTNIRYSKLIEDFFEL